MGEAVSTSAWRAAYNKTWRAANQEKVRAYDAAYHAVYRVTHREKILAQKKAYYEANREKKRAYFQAYHKANREKILARQKAWREANPHLPAAAHHRRRSRLAGRTYRVTQRDLRRLWHRQDRACAYCRAPLPFEAAEQDHVIPVKHGGVHSIGNIMLACRPCNASKNAKLPIEWYYERRYSSLGLTLRIRPPEHAEVA